MYQELFVHDVTCMFLKSFLFCLVVNSACHTTPIVWRVLRRFWEHRSLENASTMYMETSSNTAQGKEMCPVISFMWLKRLLKATCILPFYFIFTWKNGCENWSVQKKLDWGLHDNTTAGSYFSSFSLKLKMYLIWTGTRSTWSSNYFPHA